jgi:hypothetical protein
VVERPSRPRFSLWGNRTVSLRRVVRRLMASGGPAARRREEPARRRSGSLTDLL